MGRSFLLVSFLLSACSGGSSDCVTEADCSTGQMCTDGVCVVRPDAAARDAGPCGAAGCECTTIADCPLVEVCADVTCETSRCVVVEHDERCPSGVCSATRGCVGPAPDAGTVDGGAAIDAGAAVDAGVDAGPPATDAGPPHPIGTPCAAAAECTPDPTSGAATRCENDGDGYPGGYCTHRCFLDSNCAAGSVCWESGGFRNRICVLSCASDADCRASEGYVCGQPIDGMLSSDGCLPAGSVR